MSGAQKYLRNRFIAMLLALSLAIGLLPIAALAAQAEDPAYYTITIGDFSNGTIYVDYKDDQNRYASDKMQPGKVLRAKPGCQVRISAQPDSNYFVAAAYYTVNDETYEFTGRKDERFLATIDSLEGDLVLEIAFAEKFSIAAPEFENGTVTYTQYGVTNELKSGEIIPYAIDPMAGLDLVFTADAGYLVGSDTYCLDNDTAIHLGFNGKKTSEQISIREETGFVGNVTVYPVFVPIVGEGQFGITAGNFANAVVTLTQTIDGETTSRILDPNEIYALDADTEVTITIHPAPNYSLYSGYLMIAGKRQWLSSYNAAGQAVTATVKVTGDITATLNLTQARPPWDAQLYAVSLDDSGPGMVIRDHITAYVRETVVFQVKVDSGWEVDYATVTTARGESVRVLYQGINPQNNARVFWFTMPADSVTISVTYKAVKS